SRARSEIHVFAVGLVTSTHPVHDVADPVEDGNGAHAASAGSACGRTPTSAGSPKIEATPMTFRYPFAACTQSGPPLSPGAPTRTTGAAPAAASLLQDAAWGTGRGVWIGPVPDGAAEPALASETTMLRPRSSPSVRSP